MQLLSLTPNNVQKAVREASEAIRKGGVLIAPTDTVYGIIANAFNEEAIKKVYSIKKRNQDKPLPVFVKNIAMAKKIAFVSPRQEKFLEEKWPGKITVVLRKRPLAKVFGTAQDTIALRIPFYYFINSLLESLDIPLCATSANISGNPATVKIDEAIGQFINAAKQPDMAINAGDLPESQPSAIIDLTKKEPVVIRQ